MQSPVEMSLNFVRVEYAYSLLNMAAVQEREPPDVHFSAAPQSPEILACNHTYRSAGSGTHHGERLQVVHERSLTLPLAHLSAAKYL